MKNLFVFLFCLISFNPLIAQKELLMSGPMSGYSTMKECGIWLQTKESAEVKIQYWTKDFRSKLFETNTVLTNSQNSFIAHLIADQVAPGFRYSYKVIINNEEISFDYPLEFQAQDLWQHRNDPPDFSIALGSCSYVNEPETDRPGNSYGGNYEIFTSIYNKKPDLMLWLGDNTYLREADWNSKTGIYHRFTHTRALKEMQPLLAGSHHFAIWDDHDYGPNNSDRSFWNKKITEQAFKDFWMNPNYNMTGEGGITGTFFWNDCQFFLLDNRYFRTANERKTGNPEVLGKAQIDWLINALSFSRAKFKFILVGGQFISSAAVFENHANLAPEERKELIDLITTENIPGVIFLSGDRHHTELSKMERKSSYPLHDWTVSPLTAGFHAAEDEGNTNIVAGSGFGERCFGIIDVSGPSKERKIDLKLYNTKGDELWKYTIKSSDLN